MGNARIQIFHWRVGSYENGCLLLYDIVEADNKEKLLSFYENYGFKRFDTRQTVSCEAEPHELVQLLRLL